MCIRDSLNRLNMYESEVDTDSFSDESGYQLSWSDPVPFSSDIIDVTYSPHSEKIGTLNHAYAINFDLTVSKGGITYDKNSLVALKNKPKFTTGENAVQVLLELVFNH